jgi:spore coat protein CotH
MLRDRFRFSHAVVALLLLGAVPQTARTQPARAAATPAEPDVADPFFNDTLVHDIKLTINARDWESLKVHYLENTVYPCYLQWQDQIVRNVGIRSRGTGSRSGAKPGLRVDFDYYSTDQKFLGLKSVILRNNTQDPSNMRERISMLFFRRMDVSALREAHARLFINSEYAGVYTIVESLDKSWLKKNLGENDGHLYEYKFDTVAPLPYAFGYAGSDAAAYTPLPFKPQTHESDPQGQVLERFFWTVNQASDAVWRTAIEEFLDLKGFIRHIAIENFLADQDDLTGDYGPNNFYLYRFENKNLFKFLPWDKSNTFWEAPSQHYWIFRNIEDGPEPKRNRLVIRALKDVELRELYLDTLLECASRAIEVGDTGVAAEVADPAQRGWLESEIVREYEQIRIAVAADTVKLSSNADFEKAIADIRSFARFRSQAVRDQVAADRAQRARR